jgi:hypothetical protein
MLSAAMQPSSDLGNALISILPALPAAATLQIRVAASPFASCDPPAKCDDGPCKRRHWLYIFSILDSNAADENQLKEVSAKNGAESASNVTESVLSALFIGEYITSKSRSLHIEKVDSTGIRPPASEPSLTRALVAAALRHIILQSSDSEGLETILHCFARPQPEYLFPESSKRDSKKPMEPPQLTIWWLRTMDLALPSELAGTRKLLYCPPNDLASLGNSLRTASVELKWTYDHPYDPSAVAADVVHVFPDDPKGRLLKDLGKESTIKELWDIGGLAQDAAGGGFLWIMVPPGVKKEGAGAAPSVTEVEWKKLISELEGGDWSTAELAQEARKTLLASWPSSGQTINVLIPGGGSATKKEAPKVEAATLNVGLLKRKPKADAANAEKKTKIEL